MKNNQLCYNIVRTSFREGLMNVSERLPLQDAGRMGKT